MSDSAIIIESRAVVVGGLAFILLGGISLVIFGWNDVPLGGRQSAGEVAAIGAALLGAGAYITGQVMSGHAQDAGAPRSGGRIRAALDVGAVALAVAFLAFLLWLGLFSVFQRAFLGAELYPLAGAVLVGATAAISAYFAFLSGSGMTAYRLAALLAVFLASGILTSMLTAADPNWWMENLSALGTGTNLSGVAFNATLIVGGVVMTSLSSLATKDQEVTASSLPPPAVRRVRSLQLGIALLGVFLACVGLFPVHQQYVIHVIVASGMLVVFGALVFNIRRLVPELTVTFGTLGNVFLAVIAVAVVLYFPLAYYNLTAVELIAAFLVFAWLILLIRNLAAIEIDRRHPTLDSAGSHGPEKVESPQV